MLGAAHLRLKPVFSGHRSRSPDCKICGFDTKHPARLNVQLSTDLPGRLEVRKRGARTGRNPATGEMLQIAASKKVAFRPAKELKEAV